MEKYKKNKRTYEHNAIQIEIEDDLETLEDIVLLFLTYL